MCALWCGRVSELCRIGHQPTQVAPGAAPRGCRGGQARRVVPAAGTHRVGTRHKPVSACTNAHRPAGHTWPPLPALAAVKRARGRTNLSICQRRSKRPGQRHAPPSPAVLVAADAWCIQLCPLEQRGNAKGRYTLAEAGWPLGWLAKELSREGCCGSCRQSCIYRRYSRQAQTAARLSCGGNLCGTLRCPWQPAAGALAPVCSTAQHGTAWHSRSTLRSTLCSTPACPAPGPCSRRSSRTPRTPRRWPCVHGSEGEPEAGQGSRGQQGRQGRSGLAAGKRLFQVPLRNLDAHNNSGFKNS